MGRVYYDFHIHSCLSPCGDNDMTPANIAGMAFVNGLDAIALTDHNSVKNCPALLKAASQYGITALCGMELTTEEEVHTVCLFPDLTSAEKWGSYVAERLMRIENNPDIFGRQLVMDSEENVLEEEKYLLINATAIDFENVFDRVWSLGGIAYPAHVDKNANSLISNLGFVPPDSSFKIAEVHNPETLPQLTLDHPYFKNCRILSGSDAHYLENINTKKHFLDLDDTSPKGIIRYLRSVK